MADEDEQPNDNDAADATRTSSSSASDASDEPNPTRTWTVGCDHYSRSAMLVCPDCDQAYWCRHCHDAERMEAEPDPRHRHQLDRSRVNELVCGVCSTRQSVSSFSTNASSGTTFGEDTCLKCPFFDHRTVRQYFHCDECGICRVGGRENFFHCPTCEGCFAKGMEGNHTCVERSLKQNCPVCFEYQFDSVHPNTVLRCGHTIHVHCLHELEANCSGIVPTCPICKKSLADYSTYWQALDREIEQHEVPEEYRGWTACIACNDCGEETNDLPFNLMALKCGNPSCGSYNTTRLTVLQGNGVELAE